MPDDNNPVNSGQTGSTASGAQVTAAPSVPVDSTAAAPAPTPASAAAPPAATLAAPADMGTATSGGGGAAATTKVSGDGIVIDKNKSQEQYIKEAEQKYIIPRLVREKFPDLVKLIYETESMNDEEREYWMQIMPIMTEDQIVKFREILVNEKQQLSKLDKDYEAEMARINGKTTAPPIDEAKLKEKLQQIDKQEKSKEEEEKLEEAALLKQLEGIDE